MRRGLAMGVGLRVAALVMGLLGWVPVVAAQVLEDLSPAAIQRQLAPGDLVQATVSDGRTFALRIVKVEDASFTGTTPENRRFRIRYSALTALERRDKADGGVVALPAARTAPPSAVLGWFGINAGILSGDIDVPCAAPGDTGCSEGGGFTSFGLNVTVAGPLAGRLRAVHGNEDTEHSRPIEVAALIGPRLGEDFYLLVGMSSVNNPDDDYAGSANGVAWEVVFAPTSLGQAGVEIALHGAVGDDLRYAGLSFGVRFGRLR